jgi:hypothetical protein
MPRRRSETSHFPHVGATEGSCPDVPVPREKSFTR